jgi:branched-chain amino acid transport system substrate-binding protein
MGPIFSGNVKVTMQMLQQAEIPHFIGGEAAELTSLGDTYLFRTSFGQQIGMPKIANFIRDELKAKTVALIWVNNDFGKGGRDRLIKELTARDIKLAADVSTESGQVDFAADVVKLKAANADVVFVYSNEEECARIMREAKKQGLKGPFVGDTTLLSQKTIELAGEAADGVMGHVGLTADAPLKEVEEFKAKFVKRFNYAPDHNGLKGYSGVYAVKYVTEKLGKLDRKGLAATLHGLTIAPKDEPGILIETSWDGNGEIDRISFLAEVAGGKQKITKVLPKIGK